jgi:hypothetical protein
LAAPRSRRVDVGAQDIGGVLLGGRGASAETEPRERLELRVGGLVVAAAAARALCGHVEVDEEFEVHVLVSLEAAVVRIVSDAREEEEEEEEA